MDEKKFIKDYLTDLSSVISPNEKLVENLIMAKNLFLKTNEARGKIMIFGNGGSAAISSHVSVDLTKNARIRCVNYNEADLITCFSNDYGYDYLVKIYRIDFKEFDRVKIEN